MIFCFNNIKVVILKATNMRYSDNDFLIDIIILSACIAFHVKHFVDNVGTFKSNRIYLFLLNSKSISYKCVDVVIIYISNEHQEMCQFQINLAN